MAGHASLNFALCTPAAQGTIASITGFAYQKAACNVHVSHQHACSITLVTCAKHGIMETDPRNHGMPSANNDCVSAGWFCASRGEVDRMSQAYPDDATSAAVIGCGPVGLMAILAAQAQGAEKV